MSMVGTTTLCKIYGTLHVAPTRITTEGCEMHEMFYNLYLKNLTSKTYTTFDELIERGLLLIDDYDKFYAINFVSAGIVNPFIFIEDSEENLFYTKNGLRVTKLFKKDEVTDNLAKLLDDIYASA
ncbi:hypothetical protein HNP86_001836 [Methanococcus maripaludis]|uniref:Uncharacterized protein n=1 Tax=Methanococcus maripaludis TaxID=39152 RepID=A0A7J9NWH6_METMI|nr:hypothetical protein [Methanococcus maripaludis]MBA2851677.1 hypothetical protein [Methanococcus maripaludis]